MRITLGLSATTILELHGRRLLEVVARVPVVVAVHLEAINHCHLRRAELAAAVPGS